MSHATSSMIYHGSCKGVDRSFPRISSAVPISLFNIIISSFFDIQGEQSENLRWSPGSPEFTRLAYIKGINKGGE
jgi:hypothetical protein